jgi:hypothetical protein
MADRYCPAMMHPFLFCDADVNPRGEAGTNRHSYALESRTLGVERTISSL